MSYADEAEEFFAELFGGKHRIPSPIRMGSDYASVSVVIGGVGVATFDDDLLTRLVFLAHERGFRAALQPSAPRHVRILITKRDRSDNIAEGHPTLYEALLKFRNRPNDSWARIYSERIAERERLAAEAATVAGTTDCWCHECKPISMENMRMIVCPVCHNKRCPKANHHNNACSNSNASGQPGSAY